MKEVREEQVENWIWEGVFTYKGGGTLYRSGRNRKGRTEEEREIERKRANKLGLTKEQNTQMHYHKHFQIITPLELIQLI